MDHATQQRLIARIRELLRHNSTDLASATYRVAARDYTHPSELARELQALFFGGSLLAGLSSDAHAPGDWFSFEACGRSVVVWRGADGSLRAFVNACRHRGMRVASGCGHADRVLMCPYHSWTYDGEGRLAAIPGAAGFSDVDRDELRLAPVPVREEAGLIFVGLAPGSRGDASLDGAEAELAPFDLTSYRRVERREHRFAFNWKLVVDSFMEAYHLDFLHEHTLRPMFHGNVSIFDAFGRNGRIVGVRSSFDQITDGNLLPHVTLLYQLFPNAVLIYQQDHIELYQAFPDPRDPNACETRLTLYAPRAPETDGERRHWKKNFELIDGVTTTEDFGTCEKIQANLRAEAVPFIVLGRNEPGVAHFHRILKGALASCT